MTNTTRKTPSLLDPEATGGQIAEEGFEFQDAVLLSRLPLWLADDGFTSAIREAFGDVEVSFYVPGRGTVKEFLECKKYAPTPVPFWKEIERFQQMDAASSHTYRAFELVANGISADLRPLVNALRRVRAPGRFFAGDPALTDQSIEDYIKVVTALGRSRADAEFLLNKVRLTTDFNVPAGAALFRDNLSKSLPHLADLSQRTVGRIISELQQLLGSRLGQPYYRRELEMTIDSAIPPEAVPSTPKTRLFTAATTEESGEGLRFEWADLFGGPERDYPEASRWVEALDHLRATQSWINEHRRTRAIRLEGSRRLSTAFALGSTFSAVAGFTVEMNHRGTWWSTAEFAGADTPPYEVQASFVERAGTRLVVMLGIMRSIEEEVQAYLAAAGLDGESVLALLGDAPVVSAAQANLIVRQVKDEISKARRKTRAEWIDVFYAGPSHLALFLGHRMNGSGPIQCYERIGVGQYVPTWSLTT